MGLRLSEPRLRFCSHLRDVAIQKVDTGPARLSPREAAAGFSLSPREAGAGYARFRCFFVF